ncbi:hypothetical protein EJB05_43211, partial [Eragrostis curvula]
MGELPHRSIHALSKRYGPLVQLRFGSVPVVVGASAEMAKFFLKTHDAVFCDRPKFTAGKYTAYDHSDILLAPYGSYWRQARRICVTELFSAKRLESLQYIRNEEVRGMLQNLRGVSGRAVRIRDYLRRMTVGVITRMVLGKKYVEEEAPAEGFSPSVTPPAKIEEMVDEFLMLNGVLNIGDFVPWLDWLDLQGYVRRMKRMAKMFDRFLEHVLEEHNERRRREGERFVARDMLDVLLQLADDPSLEVQLSRDNVKALTLDDGRRDHPHVTPPAKIEEMVDEFLMLNGVLNIGDFVPWLDWLDLQGYVRRMKRMAKMFDRFLEHVLEEHNERRRREGERFVARDMLDVLLQLADDPSLEVQLSRDNVKALTLLPTWAAYLAIVLATVLFLKTILSRGSQTYKLPPGPKPWPIIGNLNLMGELPHRSIHALSKRYGPLVQLRFGSVPVVVGASTEMAKFFLKTHDAVFCDRPKFTAGKYTAYDHSDILWSSYGSYWRQARRICVTKLFSAKRLESLQYIRDEEVREMLRNLRGVSERAVRVRDYLRRMTFGVISRMVLGKKYVEEEALAEVFPPSVTTPTEIEEMVDEFLMLNGVFNIGDFVPWLDWLDLQGYVRRMKRMAKMFDRFLEHVLEEHNERRRREGERFVARDMLDVLLQLADDPSLEVQLSRDNEELNMEETFLLAMPRKVPLEAVVEPRLPARLYTGPSLMSV